MRALEAIAAGHDLGPLRARDLEVARNGLELVVTGNRADLAIRIESMADFERAHLLAKQGHEPVLSAGGYDQPPRCRAALPADGEHGRASCKARVFPSGEIPGVAVSKQTNTKTT